jgi:formylglycine-generating enzyme required for sulfatase activity
LNQFRRPLNEGGWIPWSLLAVGLAVFGLMAAVVVSHLGRTAVVTDIKDPGVGVAVKGTPQTITVPDQQSVTFVPGGAAPEQNASSPTASGKTPLLSRTPTHEERRTGAALLRPGSIWAGNRSYRRGSIPDATVTYELHVRERDGTKFQGHIFDNGPGRNRAEVIGEVNGDTITWREQGRFPELHIDIQGKLVGDSIRLTLQGKHVDGTTYLEGDGELMLQPSLAPTFKNSFGMEFVLVPKGKSWLGGGSGKPGEKEVVIARDFYLGKYEVTQEEWEKVTGLTPSAFSRTGVGGNMVKDITDGELRRFPVENVAWDDVQGFLERLNNAEKGAGWVYRLPMAAEWEYACRGGPLSDKSESAYDFYFDKPSNQLLPDQANVSRVLQRTCKVGSYSPNRLGLYDMHGNVWEWCNDPERTADRISNREPRGGGWSTVAAACNAANRLGPARWEARVGLRLVRSSGE